MEPTVKFGPRAKPADVTPHSMTVLLDLMRACGERTCVITSTRRSATDQARVMLQNLERDWAPDHKADRQHALYGPAGDAVIDVYEAGKRAGKSIDVILVDMTQKIVALGPYNVSHHAADPVLDGINVFDVAPDSLRDHKTFTAAAAADRRVKKVIAPPTDPAVHLEISQPS